MAVNVFRGGSKTEKDVPVLQKQTEDYALRVEYERIRVEELEAALTKTKKGIRAGMKMRRAKGGHDAPRQAQYAINKQVRRAVERASARLTARAPLWATLVLLAHRHHVSLSLCCAGSRRFGCWKSRCTGAC